MYCVNCGQDVDEKEKFCSNCGTSLKDGKVEKDILLEITPSYKFFYIALPGIFKAIIRGIPFLIAWYLLGIVLKDNDLIKQIGENIFIIVKNVLLLLPVILVIIELIKSFIHRKQYKHYKYTFYKDKVIFMDTFLNISQRELCYEHIKEINQKQSLIQRLFNIGIISMYSNAETGAYGGIIMRDIENVKEVYEKINNIINSTKG
ncbi:MAG: PH domain-containing protein [Clostridia bacterium]|nr:PH domain-containing protein [Clostridia bacterium]